VIDDSKDMSMSGVFLVRRKATKRAVPWSLTARALNLGSPPKAEDIPARKNPRLEEPLPTITDEAAKKTASPDISVGLPPPAAANDDANVNPVTDTHLLGRLVAGQLRICTRRSGERHT
jgi:hypothetical protein